MSRVEKSRLNPSIFESRGSRRFRDVFKMPHARYIRHGEKWREFILFLFFERGRKTGKFSSAISHLLLFYASRVLLLLTLLARHKSSRMQSDDGEIDSSYIEEARKKKNFLPLYIDVIFVLSFEIGLRVSGISSSE